MQRTNLTGTTKLPMKSFLLILSSSHTSKHSSCTSEFVILNAVYSAGESHTGLKPLSSTVLVLNPVAGDTPSELVRVTCAQQ